MTPAANRKVWPIHERTPLSLAEKERQELWLDPTITDVDELGACLASPDSEDLEMFPVSDLVSSARNQGPELVEPLT